jgi:hypothetical protein
MKKFILLPFFFTTLSFASYEEHFPRYFEYCTGTQLKYQKEYFGGSAGGIGGHGFMYIHGLCKDYTKNYPQVISCAELAEKTHEGVGISLDSDFSNVAWIAVPGRDLMMNGEAERKPLNDEEIDAIAKRAVELKIFENVKMKPEYVSRHEFNSQAYQHAAAMYSIGTDLAVNLARELRCVRIPVPEQSIKEAARYLNQTNDSYYNTGKEYKWDMAKNNCTHLAMNTSHAMGINPSIATDQMIVKQVFSLAIPANAYLMYVDKAILKKQSEARIKRSRAFRKFGFHPSQVGSLVQKYEAYPSSAMFVTDELKGLTLPRKNVLKLLSTPAGYDSKVEEQKYTDLKKSSLRWHGIYSRLLEKNEDPEIEKYLREQLQLTQQIQD